MWEKLNKLSVQVIAAMTIIIGSFLFLFLLAWKPVPAENAKLIDILGGIIIGSTLTAVVGWLFTTTKHNSRQQKVDGE